MRASVSIGRPLGWAIFFALGLVVPSVAIVDASLLYAKYDARGPQAAVGLCVAAYAAAKLASIISAGERKYLHFFFWLYVYVWLGLAPALQLLAGRFPVASQPSYGGVWVAWEIVIVGLLAFELGSALAFRSRSHSARSRMIDTTRLSWLGFASIALSSAVVASLGAFGAYFGSREAISVAIRGASDVNAVAILNIVAALVSVPPFVALLALTEAMRAGKPRTVLRLGLLCGLLLVNVVVNNPISQSRYWAGTVIGGFALASPTLKSRVRCRAALLSLVAVCVLLFPYADYFRMSNRDSGVLAPSITEQLIQKMDYDSFAMIAEVSDYVDRKGHTLGRQLLGPLLFWVPRSLWPDKPIDTSVVVAESLGWAFTNVSCPLWAESFIDVGLSGVAIVFFVVGYAGARMTRDYLVSDGSQLRLAVLLYPVVSVYSLILLRGSLLQASAKITVVALVFFAVSKRRRPSVRETPAARVLVAPGGEWMREVS